MTGKTCDDSSFYQFILLIMLSCHGDVSDWKYAEVVGVVRNNIPSAPSLDEGQLCLCMCVWLELKGRGGGAVVLGLDRP